MKKLILFLSLFASICSAQQLAVKTFAKDTATDLKSRIKVWQVTVDAKAETVTYVYVIETLAPKGGGVVTTSDNKTYTRYNRPAVKDTAGVVITPAKKKYNEFINGAVGQALLLLIQNDIKDISRKEDAELLLEQK